MKQTFHNLNKRSSTALNSLVTNSVLILVYKYRCLKIEGVGGGEENRGRIVYSSKIVRHINLVDR